MLVLKQKPAGEAYERMLCLRGNVWKIRFCVPREKSLRMIISLISEISACWTPRTWCWPCQTSGNFFAFRLIFGLILRFFCTWSSNFQSRVRCTKSKFCSLCVPCVLLPRATQDNSKERNLVAVLVFTSQFFQNSKGAKKMDTLLYCKFNIDTACVELRNTDGGTLIIDCSLVKWI